MEGTKTNHGKNLPAQSMPEMVEAARQTRQSSKLYKAQSAEFSEKRIAELISKTTKELGEVAKTEPVSLSDTSKVQERTLLYLRACQDAAALPSMAGLARSMGLRRRSLYHCIETNSPAATAHWLEVCRDAFSDVLSDTALRNDCNSIVAIFLQKAQFGLRETVEIVAKTDNPIGDEISQDVLTERTMGSVVDDLEDTFEYQD